MPSSDAKRAEQQRLRREKARQAAAAAWREQNLELAIGEWPHERPPRLQEDFGGEAGRDAYEIARARWYGTQESAMCELPSYDPNASAEQRKEQIGARAKLWDQAVRAYKEKLRERDRSDRVRAEDDDERRLLEQRRSQQQQWVDDAMRAENDAPSDSLPWPACEWPQDMQRLSLLQEFLKVSPPTGEQIWCSQIEHRAAELYLAEGEVWDDVVAPAYRMLTSLPSTPRALCSLPLGDRL